MKMNQKKEKERRDRRDRGGGGKRSICLLFMKDIRVFAFSSSSDKHSARLLFRMRF